MRPAGPPPMIPMRRVLVDNWRIEIEEDMVNLMVDVLQAYRVVIYAKPCQETLPADETRMCPHECRHESR